MNKKNIILLTILLIPSVLWAHGIEILYYVSAMLLIPALPISLILLYKIRKRIVTNNKFAKFILLFLIEIVLLIALMIIFSGLFWAFVG